MRLISLNIKATSLKIVRLVFGFLLFAVGTVCIINAKIGVSPWDVFHQGLSKLTGITLGQASISTGVIIIAIDIYLGQPIGWSTVSNMLLIGTFIDLLMLGNLVPSPESFIPSLILLLFGIVLQGFAVFLYMPVGWGAGPRDGLMVVLMNKTGKSVRFIKSIIEIFAVSIGYLLGGNLGVGTIIFAFMTGPIWQYIFKLLKFNVNEVEHRFIQDDIKLLKEKYLNKTEAE
ncbi:MAG: hypothetical protein RIN55_09810 [Tissierellaceae bacterium]|nr:hypothetical protein [Tissierellaceae bacterium]